MQKNEVFLRLTAFMESLSEKDSVGVLVHCDPDVLASGAVILSMLKKKAGKEANAFSCSPYGGHELMQKKLDFFHYARCNKLIVADLSFDQDNFFVQEAESFCDAVLFIDHHKIYQDLNSDKTVFIKAQFVSDIDPSKYPASKLCFDLFSDFCDLSDVAWVACVGILGDASGLQWKAFLDETLARTGFSLKQLEE